MKRILHEKKWQLNWPLSLLAAVLLAGGITLVALWCQPNSLRAVLAVFRGQPLLIILNAMPVGLVLLAAAFLFRNVFYGAALVNFAVGCLSIANRIKIEVRNEPVFPRDFALLKEAGSAMGAYDIHYPVAAIAVVIVLSVVLAAMGVFVGHRPFPLARLQGWLGRILGAAVSMAALAGLIVTVYASNDLYDSFRVSNAYYIPSVFNELGFPYCFCHQFTTYLIDKPAGYDRAEAESWETGDTTGDGAPVHVIMVMNEAFSDLTDYDVFTYSKEDDPLTNLHAMQEDPNCISGHVVVPSFAGGTANTEFDTLTGMQTNAISSTTTSAFRAANRNLDSVLRVFARDGYHSSFFHPGDDWFYNRENVYRWFGANETVFADEMEGLAYKGGWVTDDSLASYVESRFEEAVEQGQLLCNFTTTIQNHMSYTAEKYGEGYDYPPAQTSMELSEQAETLLEVYIEGVRDADAMLGRLWSYFSEQSEPVVLLFFGDHLPYLGDNQLAYSELGLEIAMPEAKRTDPFCSYETPYVIWANDTAAEILDWDNAVEGLDLPEDDLSACYLGELILELTGREQESPWFSFLSQLRRELPVIQKLSCLTADGQTRKLTELPETQQEQISKLRKWSYYKLKEKTVS